MKYNKWIIFLIPIFFACGTPGTTENRIVEQMDQQTLVRFKQYMAQGKELYDTYCMACHQTDGKGLAELYPPLAGSDYLLDSLPRAACIIRNGLTDPIVVNGTKYTQMMPGLQQLTPLEIAEIITFVSNSWGNESGLITTMKVSDWLKTCE